MKPVFWIFVLLSVQAVFPATNARTLRQRYKEPKPGTFLVRPDVVAKATFGKSGNTCQLVIKRDDKSLASRGYKPAGVIDYKLLKEIEDELVPVRDRGRYVKGMFLDVLCPPANDCAGTQETWKKVSIRDSAGNGGANYAVIYWNRKECSQKSGIDSKP